MTLFIIVHVSNSVVDIDGHSLISYSHGESSLFTVNDYPSRGKKRSSQDDGSLVIFFTIQNQENCWEYKFIHLNQEILHFSFRSNMLTVR
ncbi:hypothetical protein V6N11_018710 [Hibiscus sabdariffa]|uniref:Uncharacterized protein n=1 Tax=Hibiscus sabdariffa TaxID=183260 RepID=A0ABR2QT63_9ROSI